jgi:hypothetical protein
MKRRVFLNKLIFLTGSALLVGCAPRELAGAGSTPTPRATEPLAPTGAPQPTPAAATATPALIGPKPPTRPASQAAAQFTILHTNDSNGYLDPCG